MKTTKLQLGIITLVVSAGILLPNELWAHCDTLDGPVVLDAKTALAAKDVAPVLKWVNKESEAEIKRAFAKTLAVRSKGKEVQELADQFFFETLVRVHRMGEGAPYTGLKPAGIDPGPAITGAERAIKTGNVTPVLNTIFEEASAAARKKLAVVREKQKHADHNADAGRAYVAAYVDYIHYLEGLHQSAQKAQAAAHEEHQCPSATDATATTPAKEHSPHEH